MNEKNKAIVTSGKVNILDESKVNGVLDFNISDVQERYCSKLPYLYYKGYVVTYTPSKENNNSTESSNNNSSNEKVKLEVTESDNGFIQIN